MTPNGSYFTYTTEMADISAATPIVTYGSLIRTAPDAFYCSLSWPDTSMQSEWNALTGWAADKMNTPKGGGSSRAHFLFLVIDVDEVETGS